MFFSGSISTLLLSVAFLAALAIVHALIAWPLARRYGMRALAFSTVAATVLVFGGFWAVSASAIHASGLTVQRGTLIGTWPFLVPLLVAFGFSSLSLRKSILRADGTRPSPDTIVRATGAFFGGFVVLLLAALLLARIGGLVS